MISLRTCVIALAIVLVSIQTASSAISCFTCDEGLCTGSIPNGTCDASMDRCLAITYKDKKPFHLRCANKDDKTCEKGLYANCKLCDKDNCNSSSFVLPSIFTVTIFAAAVTKMYL